MLGDLRSRAARQAIESLRAGVPNATAVDALGIQEPEILDTFSRKLERLNIDSSVAGFFIEGDFGSGKSHILRYCESYAMKRRVAVSAVTISKETPLGDASALYRAAVAGINYTDGRLGGSLGAIFDGGIDINSAAYVKFFQEVCDESSKLDPLFRASIQLYERFRGSPDIVEQLVEFWDGAPAPVATWKRLLKQVDAETLKIKSTPSAQLAPDRFQFAAMALVVAGYKGWLVTVDEIELIAKFGIRARCQAYGNIDRLFGLSGEAEPCITPAIRGILFVGAITTDLVGELLIARNDREALPTRFAFEPMILKPGLAGFEQLVAENSRFAIRPLRETDLAKIQDSISKLYRAAYNFDLDGDSGDELARITKMSRNIRQNVRGWISYWDLKRINPTYCPNLVTEDLVYDLSEDADLPEEIAV